VNKRLKVILVIILALGLIITGCSTGTNQDPWIGKPAPDFQFQNLEGQLTSLSDLQGKPVLINFWAVRCPPCRMEMPYLQQVYDGWSGKGLVFLAINNGESPSQIGEFMQSQGFSFPVLLDTRVNIAQEYNIQYIPTTFFIDKNGIIQDMKVGAFSSKEEIEKSLNKIIP